MRKKVFVDGLSGTTGLKIHERLANYSELELITVDYEKRRDPKERAKCLNAADIVFLCLPDDASREAVELITNPNTKIIDASTAFRTDFHWSYGLPELSKEHRAVIRDSKRVSNPGCHATAFNLSIYPLLYHHILPSDYPTVCYSLTGYSGGGKSLIEKYEKKDSNHNYIKAPRPYGLTLNHKHLPEMMKRSGLEQPPVFVPIVSNFYQGLAASIPLHTRLLHKSLNAKQIHELFCKHYENETFVKVMPYAKEDLLFDGGLDITACNGTNRAEICIFGNDNQGSVVIMTRLDNLGKGASGAAIQNMNLMLGFPEDLHLA